MGRKRGHGTCNPLVRGTVAWGPPKTYDWCLTGGGILEEFALSLWGLS